MKDIIRGLKSNIGRSVLTRYSVKPFASLPAFVGKVNIVPTPPATTFSVWTSFRHTQKRRAYYSLREGNTNCELEVCI